MSRCLLALAVQYPAAVSTQPRCILNTGMLLSDRGEAAAASRPKTTKRTQLLALTLIFPTASLAADPSFAKDVAPIFAANCAGCHAGNVTMGTLDLDTFAGVRKGGHSGPVIVPGKSAEGPLYLQIAITLGWSGFTSNLMPTD